MMGLLRLPPFEVLFSVVGARATAREVEIQWLDGEV